MSINAVNKNFDLEITEIPRKKAKEESSFFVLAKYSSVGYYVVTPLLIGVFLGFGLDLYFNSKPFFVLFFIIIGFMSTIYNMYRLIKEEEKKAHHATHQHKG